MTDAERIAQLEARLAEVEQHSKKITAELSAKQREAELIHRVTAAANLAKRLEDVAQATVDLVCAYTGWPIGHVFAVEDGEIRSLGVWHMDDPERYASFRDATSKVQLAMGAGVPRRVMDAKEPVCVIGDPRDPSFPRAQHAAELGVRAAFGFPILAGDEIVGIAEFFSLTAVEPDATLLSMMQLIGVQLGRVFERQRAERKLVFDALHDSLTGLPNRVLLLDRLERLFNRAQRHKEKFAVAFVDLDRFKVVNDSLGHHVGDELLKTVAQRLRECVRELDTVARLGGDEFAILLENVRSTEEAVSVVGRTLEAISAPAQLGAQEVVITASIGVALWDSSYGAAVELLRDADTAMYQAKNDGKARHSVFTSRMHERAVVLMRVQSDLRRAVERDELELHYQPIVELETGALAGFEALIRWRNQKGTPHERLISPLDFIPVAEETGLIVPIGRWVIEKACAQLAKWRRIQPSLTMSVNVSGRQFAGTQLSASLVGHIARSVVRNALPPRALTIEITESVLLDVFVAEATLGALATLGVGLSLDDFGTGYSSLSHVHKFPFDVLKIDRGFVSAMEGGAGESKNRDIVRTIVLLAAGLHMRVVAEGVESDEQVRMLVGLGCSHGQGYYFARPVPEAEAEAMVTSGRTWKAGVDARLTGAQTGG